MKRIVLFLATNIAVLVVLSVILNVLGVGAFLTAEGIDPYSLRTWADVRDAVRAYHMLVTINPIAGEVYNIGGTYSCSVREMLGTLLSFSTKPGITVETDPERLRPIDADLQVPDTTKFRTHTGWAPEIPFEQTMRDLLDYWRGRIARGQQFLQR